jgi:hypothetical protein
MQPCRDSVSISIHSEPGFDARDNMILQSFCFSASEEVNSGWGCKLLSSLHHAEGLVAAFDGDGNRTTETNFAGKLIGLTTGGELLVSFSKLPENAANK